jgi:hypothetical protein
LDLHAFDEHLVDKMSCMALNGGAADIRVRLSEPSAPPIAYLRAAQAYMLISMPTGISTIFGALQAILALLQKRHDLHLNYKVAWNAKFTSEIFGLDRVLRAALQSQRGGRATLQPNRNRIKDIAALCSGPMSTPAVKKARSNPNK